MTEDLEQEQEQEQETQPNEVEELAAEMGWNKEYEGDDAVDAKTYILRSRDINRNVSKKLKNVSRELEAMRDGISAIQSKWESDHKQEVDDLKDQIKSLKKERDLAVEDGDNDRYKLTNDKIEKLETKVEKASQAKPPQPKNSPHPEYVKWVEAGNEWYEEDTEMQIWANGLIKSPEYSNLPMKKLLPMLTKKAKEFFPEKFETETKSETKPSAASVASPTKKPTKPPKAKGSDLSYAQRQAARDFIDAGVVKDFDEYAQMLADQNKE